MRAGTRAENCWTASTACYDWRRWRRERGDPQRRQSGDRADRRSGPGTSPRLRGRDGHRNGDRSRDLQAAAKRQLAPSLRYVAAPMSAVGRYAKAVAMPGKGEELAHELLEV